MAGKVENTAIPARKGVFCVTNCNGHIRLFTCPDKVTVIMHKPLLDESTE